MNAAPQAAYGLSEHRLPLQSHDQTHFSSPQIRSASLQSTFRPKMNREAMKASRKAPVPSLKTWALRRTREGSFLQTRRKNRPQMAEAYSECRCFSGGRTNTVSGRKNPAAHSFSRPSWACAGWGKLRPAWHCAHILLCTAGREMRRE